MAIQVYFIGAGPGDLELLTIKAKNLIEKADVIIYADSLVNPGVRSLAKDEAEVYGSASLTLAEINDIVVNAVKQGKTVARLQSGDPSVYGAIQEQMASMDANGIQYQVIPGVSSLFAAAATLKTELTIPGLSQTVIITRMEGKTPVPKKEKLSSLADHQTTMAIFLSSSLIEQAVKELIAGGYPDRTPTAVVYRASWDDEIVIRSNLKDITEKANAAGIKRQALILVGSALDTRQAIGHYSRLYDEAFSHGYRNKGL